MLDTSVHRVDGSTLEEAISKYNICKADVDAEAMRIYTSAPGGKFNIELGSQNNVYKELDTDRAAGCIRDLQHAYSKDGGLAVLKGNIAQDGCVVKQQEWMRASGNSQDRLRSLILRSRLAKAFLVVRL